MEEQLRREREKETNLQMESMMNQQREYHEKQLREVQKSVSVMSGMLQQAQRLGTHPSSETVYPQLLQLAGEGKDHSSTQLVGQ